MRTLLCAIPALLALAGPALAEPQQLDEAQLGGIAAGQDGTWLQPVDQSEQHHQQRLSARPTRFEQIVSQSLGGVSTNSTYAPA